MSEHLSAATMNAIVDGELETTELARAEAHLAGCLQCSSECLSIGILKRRVRAAGAKYEVPEGLDLVRVLMSQRLGSVQDGVGIDHVFAHERSPLSFERMTSDP